MNATMPQPDLSKKYYTVEEANRALPLVRAIVRDIVGLYGEVRTRRERLSAIERSHMAVPERSDAFSEEVEDMENSLLEDFEQLKGYVDELSHLGLELKDPETGLVDFPSLQEGQEVRLCWQYGEDRVGHVHDIEQGFDDRRAI